MLTTDQLLSILTAKKVFDGMQWVAYDIADTPIADPDGALTKGNIGQLLNQLILIDTAVIHEGGGVVKATIWDGVHLTKEQLLHRDMLLEEDIFATEFIVAFMSNYEVMYG